MMATRMARILLTEDDASLRLFLSRALETAGHHVVQAEDGNAALPLIEADRFDLLLTDIVMPGLDGIELAQRARAIAPDLRVMFITGFAAVALTAADAAPPGAKVLSKPIHLREIVSEVERMIAA